MKKPLQYFGPFAFGGKSRTKLAQDPCAEDGLTARGARGCERRGPLPLVYPQRAPVLGGGLGQRAATSAGPRAEAAPAAVPRPQRLRKGSEGCGGQQTAIAARAATAPVKPRQLHRAPWALEISRGPLPPSLRPHPPPAAPRDARLLLAKMTSEATSQMNCAFFFSLPRFLCLRPPSGWLLFFSKSPSWSLAASQEVVSAL